jgi:hypothetical protein
MADLFNVRSVQLAMSQKVKLVLPGLLNDTNFNKNEVQDEHLPTSGARSTPAFTCLSPFIRLSFTSTSPSSLPPSNAPIGLMTSLEHRTPPCMSSEVVFIYKCRSESGQASVQATPTGDPLTSSPRAII